jgi:XTP/dITP diphosphohydrolase
MKKIVLATGNKGKVKELAQVLENFEVIAYTELLQAMEIEENGTTFAQNAQIKAKAIADALNDKSYIVLSDDSGIVVPQPGGEPGLFSARYAGVGASDEQNRQKLMAQLKARGLKKTPAHYVAAISAVIDGQIYTVHGWAYGEVLDKQRGDGGFGYDPLFVPHGYSQTLGELDPSVKKSLSHRTKAVELIKVVLK